MGKIGKLVAACKVVAAAVSVINDVITSNVVVVTVTETTTSATVTVKVEVCSSDVVDEP